MANKGGNKGRESGTNDASRRSEDTTTRNAKDEAVARDPDVRGVTRREARDVHKRGAQD